MRRLQGVGVVMKEQKVVTTARARMTRRQNPSAPAQPKLEKTL